MTLHNLSRARYIKLATACAFSAALFTSTSALAQQADSFISALTGSAEVPSIATPGMGLFLGNPNVTDTALSYNLIYLNPTGSITQAHIHYGAPGTNGGIMVYLCTNIGVGSNTVPTPPTCPAGGGSVTGSLTDADVIAVQGITDLSGVLRAIRSGNAYVNVHSDDFPPGEIRGQVLTAP